MNTIYYNLNVDHFFHISMCAFMISYQYVFLSGTDKHCNFIIQKFISSKRSWYRVKKKLARPNIPHSFNIKSQDCSSVCSPSVWVIRNYICSIVQQILLCAATHPMCGWICPCLFLLALAHYGSTGSPTEVACHRLLTQPIQLEQPTTVLSTMRSIQCDQAAVSQTHG